MYRVRNEDLIKQAARSAQQIRRSFRCKLSKQGTYVGEGLEVVKNSISINKKQTRARVTKTFEDGRKLRITIELV